ncbi:MAG TPA: HNH endonuclease [Lachnospiraceae bacterium]|nr:HNH endonuclease [Lachnospiraceae bacterium]
MVYVLSKDGQPLMPTKRYGKVKHLLRSKRAKAIKRCPFTIQLTYDSDSYTQSITLGVDAGSKTIGLSATTKTQELYAAEVTPRNDISDLLETRRSLRSSRRNRKLRYREPRFLNRTKSKHPGWLAPSVRAKVDSHLKVIEDMTKILPISKIIIETASFDLQKIKAMELGLPTPEGTDYQKGELLDFVNVREYVFWRDNYTCQWCHGKSKSNILHTHHWAYWKGDHTDKPSSQITLCDKCNDSKNHKPEAKMLWGWEPKITFTAKGAAFMGIMRWSVYNELKEIYEPSGIHIKMTYGYITKANRIAYNLPKEHRVDARCITGYPDVLPAEEWYNSKKIRCHNRQIHKSNPKRGVRKLNQAPYMVNGYRLFDKVLFKNTECYITGRRSTGYFALKTLDGQKIHDSAKVKDLKLIEPRKLYLTERKAQV